MACPDDLKEAIELAKARLRVIVEVTERAMAGDPPGCWPPSPRPARPAGAWPWTTSTPRRPAWPCCRSSAPTDQAGHAAAAATKDLLVEMCMQLEHQGLDAPQPNVLLACFQEAGQFTEAARSGHEFLATRAAFTGALGHGMPVAPVAGVRGADLAADDPLRHE